MRLLMWLFLMSNAVFAANVEELQQQFDVEKSLYEQKVSALNAAKNQANDADQQFKNAESEKAKSDQHLKEEEQSYDLAVQLAKRKKQSLSEQAQQELSAAQIAVKQADQKLLEKQSIKNKADQNLQQAQNAVDNQADKINRLDKDLKTKRFEMLQAKLETESNVNVEMTHSCGEDLPTKQCREQGRAALLADAARRGSVELLQGVSEADFVAQKLTKDQVRSEFKALVLSHSVNSETVQDGVYKGNLTVRVRGQVPDSLRPDLSSNSITPPKPQPKPQGKTFTNSIGMEFVLIPAGSFQMGSENGDSDEKPVQKVDIKQAFYLGKFEVTQKQYQAIMGTNPSHFKGENRPVENVSWNDAQTFIKKLNDKEGGAKKYRLPTEAEWEYAARAGTQSKWSFGDNENDLKDYAWYDKNSGNETHDVAQKKPNGFGLFDMHGNVWEWTCSDYGNYSENNQLKCSSKNDARKSLRGGSWYNNADSCRSANRVNVTPDSRLYSYGFRVVSVFSL